MTELMAHGQSPRTAKDYRAEIDLLLAEMLRMEAAMEQDRVEIEQSRARSEAITRHTDGVLERLERQLDALAAAE